MNYPINYYVPQYEPYVIWEKAFSIEECKKIIEYGELCEFQKGRVGSGPAGSKENIDIRNSDITWIPVNKDTEWLYGRFAELGERINYDKFQLDLTLFDGMQYTKYEKDQHYNWHIDTSLHRAERLPTLMRKMSMVLMLSDVASYEGGELQFNHSGDPVKVDSFKPRQGDMVVFYSHLPHRVAPVTEGTRITLVTWLLGPKLK